MSNEELKLHILALYYNLLSKGFSEWKAILMISEQFPITKVYNALDIDESIIKR